jgi:uncharacterized SAM-binding protein YcdF (DUF218 family)
LILVLLRAPLLRTCAGLWIVNQPITHADAIVVLGGELQTRPFAAAKLHHDGSAAKVLLMNVMPSPTTELGITPTEQELTRKVLLAEGVPACDLLEIGDRVSSSHEEAIAVRDWAAKTGAKRIIIPTDPFHTRRIQWLYAKELAGIGLEVVVTAVPQREYSASDWWCHEEGLISFQNEIIKYAFYRLKY